MIIEAKKNRSQLKRSEISIVILLCVYFIKISEHDYCNINGDENFGIKIARIPVTIVQNQTDKN